MHLALLGRGQEFRRAADPSHHQKKKATEVELLECWDIGKRSTMACSHALSTRAEILLGHACRDISQSPPLSLQVAPKSDNVNTRHAWLSPGSNVWRASSYHGRSRARTKEPGLGCRKTCLCLPVLPRMQATFSSPVIIGVRVDRPVLAAMIWPINRRGNQWEASDHHEPLRIGTVVRKIDESFFSLPAAQLCLCYTACLPGR